MSFVPRPAAALAAGSAVAGFVVLAAALEYGRALEAAIPGLPTAGAATSWGLPVATTLATAAGTIAVGSAVVGAFLVPASGPRTGSGARPDRLLRPATYRLLRVASWAALAWLVAAGAAIVLTTSDLIGLPAGRIGGAEVVSFVTDVSQGRALAIQAGLALVVAVGGRLVLSRNGAAWVAVAAVAGIVPPAFTGHAAGAGNHQVAVTSLAFHVVGAALWTGGLVALLLIRRTDVLSRAAHGYSRLALWCFVAVGLSGVLNAIVRLGTPDELTNSRYGLLVAGKSVALIVLGALGAVHRRTTLRALHAAAAARTDAPAAARTDATDVRAARAFRRLAAGEILVFAATTGLAVALSRSPTPVPSNPVDPDPVTDLVGFGMPPAPTLGRLIGLWFPDVWFGTIVVVGAVVYLAAVARLRARGDHWPGHRTACWLGGLALLASVTLTGIGRYSVLAFSVHMFQHMVLSMAVPILLVLGAPATLALRALKPGEPRAWLLSMLHSRALRVAAHPVAATALFVGSLYGLYFSGLFEAAMRSHLGHLAMSTHFVLVGYLFFWVVIGVDPGPRPLPYPVRIPVHFVGMVMHAFFGVALLQAGTVLAEGWYAGLHRPWLTDLLADQTTAASIAWSAGEIPSAAVLGVLFWQWVRADEREQRRLDRAADRAAAANDPDDDLTRYNAALRHLHDADRTR
ncbi:cytochrome c oxidase assembly protein [Cryptosporangium sp. NPDC051539]|uniref:cytochrome c oxidase assembly protein n=1 Tax=Cryptosporangium sp. NPDC051539 TaxID=3363962 RepID=UPI0037BA6E9C